MRIECSQVATGKLIGRGGTCEVYEADFISDAELSDAVREAAQRASYMVIKILNGARLNIFHRLTVRR